MDIRDLANIDTSNPEAVKSVQNWLRAQGLYKGAVDGKWGKDTIDAVAALRSADEAQRSREAALQQQQQALEAQKLKTQEVQAANDPTARLTKTATEVGPYAAGFGLGSFGAMRGVKNFTQRDAQIAEAANRLAQSTDITPQAAETGMNRLLGQRMRSKAGAFVPAALAFGAGAVTRDVIAPRFSDEGTRNIVNAIGTGENAAGLALAGGAAGNLLRDDPIDAVTRARILSRNSPQPSTPPSTPPSSPQSSSQPYEPISHADRAKSAYRAAGGTGKVTKAEAISWLETPGNVTKANRAAVVEALGQGAEKNLPNTLRILKGTGKYVIPALIAGSAADAAYSDARARGLTDTEADRNAALEATSAGIGAGGAMYAANRLLPKVSGKLAGRIAAPLGFAYDAYQQATQPNPEDQPFTRRANALAQPSSVGNPAAMAVNTALGEVGSGSLDDHIQSFMDYMRGQGAR
jgi:hypothetical protein